MNSNTSSRERKNRPRQHDAGEEEGDEDPHEESDALLLRVAPQQRKERGGGGGVEEHQDDVAAQDAHSLHPGEFMPSEVEASSMAPRRIRDVQRTGYTWRDAVIDPSTSLGMNSALIPCV